MARETTHLWAEIQAWLDSLQWPPSQAKLAERLELKSRTVITDWKYGASRPTPEHLQALAREMELTAGPGVYGRLVAAVNRDLGYLPDHVVVDRNGNVSIIEFKVASDRRSSRGPKAIGVATGSGKTESAVASITGGSQFVPAGETYATSAKSRGLLMALLDDGRDPAYVKSYALDLVLGDLLIDADAQDVFDAAERASERATPKAARTLQSRGRALRRRQDQAGEENQDIPTSIGSEVIDSSEQRQPAGDRPPPDDTTD